MSALGLSVLVHLQYKKREYVDHTAGKQLEVSVSVDVGTLPGVTVLPADVGVDVSTWVVSVLLLTVQVYTEYVNWYIQSRQLHTVQTVPVLTSFTAGCLLMLGPLTAHTFTL